MLLKEKRLSQDLEKVIDMSRMKTNIHSEAEKDSNYVHKYR